MHHDHFGSAFAFARLLRDRIAFAVVLAIADIILLALVRCDNKPERCNNEDQRDDTNDRFSHEILPARI
jgi:hypothetical protein